MIIGFELLRLSRSSPNQYQLNTLKFLLMRRQKRPRKLHDGLLLILLQVEKQNLKDLFLLLSRHNQLHPKPLMLLRYSCQNRRSKKQYHQIHLLKNCNPNPRKLRLHRHPNHQNPPQRQFHRHPNH